MHVSVGCYDDAGARVAKQPGDEDDAVDYGECQGRGEIATSGSELRLQEQIEVELG